MGDRQSPININTTDLAGPVGAGDPAATPLFASVADVQTAYPSIAANKSVLEATGHGLKVRSFLHWFQALRVRRLLLRFPSSARQYAD